MAVRVGWYPARVYIPEGTTDDEVEDMFSMLDECDLHLTTAHEYVHGGLTIFLGEGRVNDERTEESTGSLELLLGLVVR